VATFRLEPVASLGVNRPVPARLDELQEQYGKQAHRAALVPEAALPALLLLAEAWQALARSGWRAQAGLRQVAARWAENSGLDSGTGGAAAAGSGAGGDGSAASSAPDGGVDSAAQGGTAGGTTAPAESGSEPLALAGPRECGDGGSAAGGGGAGGAAWVAALLGAELSALAGPVVARLEVAGPWGMAGGGSATGGGGAGGNLVGGSGTAAAWPQWRIFAGTLFVGLQWADTSGNPIQAHGGGVIQGRQLLLLVW